MTRQDTRRTPADPWTESCQASYERAADRAMYDIDAGDLIDFAKRWAALGEVVAQQVERVVDDPNCGSCCEEGSENGVNPEAISLAREMLGGLNEGIDLALDEFLEAHGA